ncbi:TonB C-terminal domain-containing protein [Sulfurospirillum sp. T05]|uniref:TonB C-terminal domain-containing protein n=1 Tax=Sulfurospirillum tamanense TaxID=2813362 RepID=A0ABS2WQ14_9BACT|nr:TonB C-terminal domain-containing protein [Sulfurospirillum tamanensis]MBN2963688.1 TonB C-terminal domain-containing protein [Sulfurospirillum tamanensis]
MEIEIKQNTAFAFLGAVGVYVAILVGLVAYMASNQEWVQRFTSKKDSFLDVVLVERPRQQVAQVRPVLKALEPTPPLVAPTQPKPSPPKEANVRELFRGIDANKLAEPKPIPTPPAKIQSRARQDTPKTEQTPPVNTASKLVGSLTFESAAMEASATGAYDEYLGRITELLEGYWQQTIDTVSGAQASVRVSIDRQGRFSYAIVKVSYNNAFNAKLRDFLERMKSVIFPPSVEGDVTSLNVTFKDLMEQ